MRSRYFNYAVIVGLLVVSALLARLFLRPSGLSLQVDLKSSLDRFWGNAKSEVEVSGAGEVRVSVWISPDTRQRQQQWTYPVTRWVAARHPGAKLVSLVVTNSATLTPIGETPSLDSSSVSTSTPRANFADRSYFEAAKSQLLQKQGQSQLDKQLGAGRTLLLVDVATQDGAASWLPNVPVSYDEFAPKYGCRALVQQEDPLQETFKVVNIEACLLVEQQSQAERAGEWLDLGLNKARGDRLRVVILPAP